ncbi:putative lipid II flippase FtsW [Effusibacillus pohliae]|uniref:putative lipid II flippase FtsW n=1 Tax=Effusibacillus pohliae TaxID=232270 RepID=UPI0003659A23|nr:putative lipid II flippase FtsW [Effusibacillus pohliae]
MNLTRHRPDFLLLVTILLLVSIGLLTIYSASMIWAYLQGKPAHYFFIRQCIWVSVGLVAMIVTMNLPFWIWRKLLPLLLLASIGTLCLVLLLPAVKDVHRWINLGPLSFQPSELATLSIIIYASHILAKKQDQLDTFKKTVVPPLVVAGLFALLVILEPDMDAAALIVVTALAILFGSGVPLRHLEKVVLPSALAAVPLVLFSGYRRERVFSFLDPFSEANLLTNGWQQAHSLYAIASGGWTGRGLGRSIEKFGYLPEPHTDFIFSIFHEEWGAIGGILLILLFAVLVWRALRIASLLPDRFGALMAIGIAAMIGIAAFVNIGMVIGVFPVMGIPLPFITYGGTAMLMKMVAMGILLNLSRYTVEKSHQS